MAPPEQAILNLLADVHIPPDQNNVQNSRMKTTFWSVRNAYRPTLMFKGKAGKMSKFYSTHFSGT